VDDKFPKRFPGTKKTNKTDYMMGVTHSASGGDGCAEESCFCSLAALHELIASKLSPVGPPKNPLVEVVSSYVNPATPKRKLLLHQLEEGVSKSKSHASKPWSSPEGYLVERELESINGRSGVTDVSDDDDFVLMDPSRLGQGTQYSPFLIFEDGNSENARTSFSSRSQLLPAIRNCDGVSRDHLADFVSQAQHLPCAQERQPMLDFERRLKGELSETRDHFIPIRDGHEKDEGISGSNPEEKESTRSAPSGVSRPAFKLKPRKSRRVQDYKFNG